jgi:hypothetical protein
MHISVASCPEAKYLEAGEASADLAIQVLGNVPNATDVDVIKLGMWKW